MPDESQNRSQYIRVLCASLFLTPSINGVASIIDGRLQILAVVLVNLIPLAFIARNRGTAPNPAERGDRTGAFTAVAMFLIVGLYLLFTVVSILRADTDFAFAAKATLIPIVVTVLVNLLAFSMTRPTQEEVGQCLRAALKAVPALAVLTFGIDVLTGNAEQVLSAFLAGERLSATAFFSSPNTAASFYGLALVCAACLMRKGWSVFLIAAGLIALFYLLAAGSRAMVAISAVCILCLLIKPAFAKYAAVLVVLLWPLSSLVLLSFYTGLGDTLLRELLTRSEALEYGVATGRPILWETAWQILGKETGVFLFGVGYSNAAQTGLSAPLAFLFSAKSVEELQIKSLHNASLQIIFDMGIFGLILFYAILCRSVQMVLRSNLTWVLPAFLYCMLTGFNEAAGTVYFLFVYVSFISLLMICLNLGAGAQSAAET